MKKDMKWVVVYSAIMLAMWGIFAPSPVHSTQLGTVEARKIVSRSTDTYLAVTASTLAASGDVTVADDLVVTDRGVFGGNLLKTSPSAQSIPSAGTITADACGGIKLITATTTVTTDTTLTFSSPTALTAGCAFDLVNVSSQVITLDANALFVTSGTTNLVLTASDTVRIGNIGGTYWQALSDIFGNQ